MPDLYIKNQRSDISFAIAHKAPYIFVSASREKKMGVDIEKLSDRIAKLRTKFISDTENSLVHSSISNESDLLYRYTQVWSAKEAFVKCMNYSMWEALAGVVLHSITNDRVYLMYKDDPEEVVYTVKTYLFDNHIFAYMSLTQ